MLLKQHSSVQLLYVHESISLYIGATACCWPFSDPAEDHVNVSVYCIANIVKKERESLIVLFVCLFFLKKKKKEKKAAKYAPTVGIV